MAKTFLAYQQENPEFLNNYLKYNRYISFKADTTVNESYYDLRTFFRFIKVINNDKYDINKITNDEFRTIDIIDVTLEDIIQVSENIIDQFICFLTENLDNCPKSRNKKLASLKRFYEYLSNNNMITINPTRNCRTAKVGKRLPKYLSLKESKSILSKTINSNQRFNIRNYAIICIFLNCSLRLSELVNINISDIKLDEQTIKITGKGNRQRIIYLNEATNEAIEEYLKVRPKLTKENLDYNALFISERNKRISKRSIQTIIDNGMNLTFGEKKDGYHTHTLRHTGATLLYNENNVDIRIIKRILGHKTLDATEIYTHVSSKKMQEIMENCTISSIISRRNKDEKN